jgi:autotransporter-associated beta strand protein
VTVTNGGAIAANGVTLANNFTIGAPAGSQVFYTQNFNTIGGGLPTGWTVRTGASSNAVGTTSTLNTNATDWSSATGQFANYAATTGLTAAATSGQQSGSTNRALGVRTTGSFGDPGASFVYSFNTSGQIVDSISLDLMQLATNARSVTWSIEYGVGASPTSFTLLGTWADPGAWGSTSTNFSSALFSTNLNDQSNLVFRVTALSGSTGSGTRDTSAIDNFTINTIGAATGSGIVGIEEAGSATFSGNILINNVATLTAASGGTATFSGVISGLGSVTKTGDGTVTLSGDNTYSGGTTNSAGVLSIGAGGTSGSISGNVVNNATLQFNRSDSLNYAGAVSGTGALTKLGAGTTTLSGASANTYTGMTTVSAGTLELSKSADVNAIAGDITVNSGAILLLSSSGNVANSSAVTLSGGTITRGSGVNEVFGSLNLTTGSFLDFGTGATGSMTFGTYEENATPSALLTLNNFIPGNSFTFSNALFAADGSNIGSYFTFGTGFVNSSIINNGGNSFTITAIPEPSTYAAAIALLGLMLWPSRKRIVRDAKKILGFTPPMRDRLAAKRA